jgi:hypothetical protein
MAFACRADRFVSVLAPTSSNGRSVRNVGWHRTKDIRPATALLSEASAIPETPGTVDFFAHQIGLTVSAFLKHAAERMLRPAAGVRSRSWETAGICADLV